jgi:hypothetical protein
MLIYSKLSDGRLRVANVPTKYAAQRPRLVLLQEELARDASHGNNINSELYEYIDDFIDGADKSKEWPGDNRAELKKELKEWAATQCTHEAARFSEESAKVNSNHLRAREKVKERHGKLVQAAEAKIEKAKEIARDIGKEIEKRKSDARARRSLVRATLDEDGDDNAEDPTPRVPAAQQSAPLGAPAPASARASSTEMPSLAAAEVTRVMTQMRKQIEDLRNEVTHNVMEKEQMMAKLRELAAERDSLRARVPSAHSN